MPGRQAHGRPLLANSKAKNSGKRSKARSQKNALNAFGIAQENFPSRQKKTPRARELDAESERKHARDEAGEPESEEGDGAPRRKKAKGSSRPPGGDDVEYGSDSEGNEWRMGGLAEGDEDSEIESDDAFGDSDDDKFQGYSFRGSKTTKAETGDSDDDSNDDEGETLGADAVDLATALDQFEDSSDDEEPAGDEDSGSEEEEDSDSSDGSDGSDGDDEDEEADSEKLEALQGLVSEFGGGEADDEAATQPSSKEKIGLGDLGLAGLDDPFLKKSVKLMNKEEKEKRPGAAKKLDVPLPRRQQDRQDRAVAYEKTNETLDRWTETVKQNRRADHLVFPLPQNSATAGLNTTEMQPLTIKGAGNELESTIMSIVEQSGLSMHKPGKPKPQEFDEEGNLLSRKEALARRRIQREHIDREAKRAKRIKKIKSKAYHRVHRKQRERNEMAAREAIEEAGEIDSEAEREAQDRRRALERVGQRHKESKWAKMGSKNKRAVWDDDFRMGLAEMARKDEELRRRKEGRKGGGVDDSGSDASSSSGEDDDEATRRQLDALEAVEDDEPQSKLMSLKFMRKAEDAKKKANDEMIAQIRRELDGAEAADDSDDEEGEVGRRSFGGAAVGAARPALDTSTRAAKRERAESGQRGRDDLAADGAWAANGGDAAPTPAEAAAGAAGAWSRGEARRSGRRRGEAGVRVEELDLAAVTLVAAGAVKGEGRGEAKGKGRDKGKGKGKGKDKTKDKTKEKASRRAADDADDADDSDTSSSGPSSDSASQPAARDRSLLARAFGADDAAAAAFAREKAAAADADADQVVDRTPPGWGSWVGEGISAREARRHQGRFLTTVRGVDRRDRRDAGLERVIISEKRVKKTDRYLATQLPHPFESRAQYERALRLPIGPEWMTKAAFQEATKPRVLLKQAVIAPMSKPTA